MNREIKFRAWDKVLKYMIQTGYDNWISFGGECYTGSDRKYNTPNIEITKVKDLILMQYTGLKDGSGKEIYEGDIVEFHANYCSIEYCGYKAGVITWDYVQWKIVTSGYNYSIAEETDEFYYKCKIKGNIYENPELINSK